MTNPRTSNIKTIAVFTSINQEPSLSDELKLGRYIVVPSEIVSGNVENSVAVLNISLETAMHYCSRYRQKSFMFSRSNDGSLEYEYWEVQDTGISYNRTTNPYVKKDTGKSVIGMDTANDCCTEVGDFKIIIPSSILSQIDKNLDRLISDKKISDKDKAIEYTINGVGQSPYIWRGAIYHGIL